MWLYRTVRGGYDASGEGRAAVAIIDAGYLRLFAHARVQGAARAAEGFALVR